MGEAAEMVVEVVVEGLNRRGIARSPERLETVPPCDWCRLNKKYLQRKTYTFKIGVTYVFL